MRDQWYGDNLDLLKWGTLVHLAQRDRLSAILHVAMYRPDDEWPMLGGAQGAVALPVEVLRHFRNLDHVHRLSKPSGIRIEVFKAPFRHRSAYFEKVDRRVQALSGESLAVFLDPDTGLVSEKAGPEHVTEDEVRLVFAALKPGDRLVYFQRMRRHKDWRGDRRRAFARALDEPAQDVEVFASDVARDGVLFSLQKR